MYQKKNIRVYIAWMLFMTFIPFFVVKTFHYHGSEDEKSCSHAKHSHQSSDDCAICQYSLSFFTEPQPIEFHCTLTLVPYEPIIYQDKVVCKRTYSHHLRGPPVAWLSLIHISEPTRRTPISYAVFCLKKKKKKTSLFLVSLSNKN